MARNNNRLKLLFFHPPAWTGVRAKRMRSPEDYADIFESPDTVPVGMSVDSIPADKKLTGQRLDAAGLFL